jgi:integrase
MDASDFACTPILHTQTDRMKIKAEKSSAFRNVGACLYRLNGWYYARFKRNGKEIKQSLRTQGYTTAKRELKRVMEEQGQLDPSLAKLTLAQLCDRYLETLSGLKPKTLKQKIGVVDKIKKHWPTGKIIQVAKIKPTECDRWLARYHFGAASRNVYVQVLKEVFDVAVCDKVIAASPARERANDARQRERLRYMKRGKPIRRTPTFEQFQAIVESIRSQIFNGHDAGESADFVQFLGLAGLGQAEASALEWPDINWQGGQIITFRHKTSEGFAVPLFPQLRPLLEKRYAQRTGDGRVFKINSAKKAIAAACKRLKLPAYSHRSFRRTFITRAIELGIDVKTIADWQGHKDGGKLILDTYSHVRSVHSQRMAQLMRTEQPDNVIAMKEGAASITA